MKTYNELRLEKLDYLYKIFQSGSPEMFQYTGLSQFMNILERDFSDVLATLPELPVDLSSRIDKMDIAQAGVALSIASSISSFDEGVAFNYKILQKTHGNKNNFTRNIWSLNEDNSKTRVDSYRQLLIDCLGPIMLHVRIKCQTEETVFHALDRYKVLCECYDLESIQNQAELDLTRDHLTKFLFTEGYTYNLAEVNMRNRRFDNFIPRDKWSESVLAEGKIYNGPSSIENLVGQLKERINRFDLSVGHGIVFCKEKTQPSYDDANSTFGNFSMYVLPNGRKIALMNICLVKDAEDMKFTTIKVRPYIDEKPKQ